MLPVLLEDNHCLVVNKPAGVLSQGDVTGDDSLVELAKRYLKAKYNKPGNVYLGLIHRLDRPTSGVVLLARTSKAAARLSEQFRLGGVEKTYWAIVEGECPEESGIWRDWLWKEELTNIVSVVKAGTRGAVDAEVAFRVLDRDRGRTWLELKPITGRSHQLRVQLGSRGMPVVGDRKYGAGSTLPASDGGTRIALHARSLTFNHPTQGDRRTVSALTGPDWPRWLGKAEPGPGGAG